MANGPPAGLTLHSTSPNQEGTEAVCLWGGDSVAAVQQAVEHAVGQTSRNAFFAVAPTKAVGLPR